MYGSAGGHFPKDASKEENCWDLVQGLIGTFDLSDSEVVRAHVQKSLRGVGITEIRPKPGESFNPLEHNGVAAIRAPAPALAFRIARVLRPGWKSVRGTVRPADVEVYKED
jgi:molecular chaperone GrpE (heat shock protein)